MNLKHINYFENPYQLINPTGIMKEKNSIISNKFFSMYEGFPKGNMEKVSYKDYKNYIPIPIIATSEKERDLQNVQGYGFACLDLALYLDVNPDDLEAQNLFKEYLKEFLNARRYFEEIYYPLSKSNSSLVKDGKWCWVNNWKGEGK